MQNCTTGTNLRRRRSTSDNQGTTVSDMATISSGPIFIRLDNGENLYGLLELKATTMTKAQLYVCWIIPAASFGMG